MGFKNIDIPNKTITQHADRYDEALFKYRAIIYHIM